MKNEKQIKREQWQALYDDYYASGLTCRAWCKNNNIKEHRFFYMRKQLGVVNKGSLNNKITTPTFEKIDLTTPDTTLNFKINDISLEVDGSINEDHLATIIKVINSL